MPAHVWGRPAAIALCADERVGGSTTKMIVTQNLNQWLGNQITVQDVTVQTQTSTTGGAVSGPLLPDSAIVILITYVLIETQSTTQTQVQVI